MKKWNQNLTTPLRVLLAGAGIAAAAMLVPLVVSAVAPPVNTVIGNQAAASYKDASGTAQSVQSNLVSTTVAQIGSLTLSNTGNKTAAAGNTVYIPHTLTNTGNGLDSFKITAVDDTGLGTYDNVAIYADTNGTGVPSGPALCTTPAVGSTPACTAGFVQAVGGNGGIFNFVVAYTIPSTASPSTPFNTATVTAATTSLPASIPYVTPSVTQIDTVNVTAGTAFSSNKSIATPAVAAPGASSGGWPMAITSGNASSNSSCATTWSAGLTSSPTCTYTVYTIGYTNTGGATGAYSMSDTLPAGETYVKGSAVWSGQSGVALSETGATVGNITSNFVSNKFTATVTGVAPNVSGSISFVVLVNTSAAAGTSTTTNTALYKTTDCNVSCSGTTPPDVQTNPSAFVVLPSASSFKVIAASTSTATTFDKDNLSSVPPLPNKTGVDVTDVASAFLGTKVAFTNYIINMGSAGDTFNVAIDSANNNFPAGTTFAFFKADGATPLLDTNGDGKIDTGPLAAVGQPGNSVQIVVVATLPSTATSLTGPFDALMTATSVGSAAAFDSVWEQVDAIKSAKVDLTNTPAGNLTSTDGGLTTTACIAGSNCDLGKGPSSAPTFTTPTTPGTPAKFPIYITNEDATTVYNLTATVPPGWTVTFVADPLGTATCAAGPAITSISVTGGTTGPSNTAQANEVKVIACVTPPAGTTPGTTNVQITATKQGDPTVSDTITDAVNVSKPIVPSMVLGPNSGTNTVTNGGTVVQPVTLTNTGTTVCGGPLTSPTDTSMGFNVALSLDSAAQSAGWTALVYYDANKSGTIDALDVAIAATAVPNTTANLTHAIVGSLVPLLPAPGNTASLPLLVKTFAPSGAVIGSTATATLTVTDLNTVTPADNCPAQTAKYSSTVSNGQLRVLKTQAKEAGTTCGLTDGSTLTFAVDSLKVSPGDCIVYRVVATNEGNAAVSSVVLNDAVPAYTSYAATQFTTQCSAVGVTGTPAAPSLSTSGTPVTSLSCGTVSLNPAGTITMFYKVKVQN